MPQADFNPLLNLQSLTRFDLIQAEHITPAITTLLERAQAAVTRLEQDHEEGIGASWDNVVEALERGTEPLGRAWGVIGHLNSVADTPALREAFSENLARVTEFWSSLGQNERLYERYKALAASAAFSGFSPAQKQLLSNELRGFRLGGAELPESVKPRFAEIQEEQARASKSFSDHVLDATNAFSLTVTDPDHLKGLPEDVVAAAAQAQQDAEPEQPGWRFTLHFPSYYPVLQYAEHRPLREQLYKAYVTRASELGVAHAQGQADWDNTQLIQEILRLRQEEAQLLGYPDYGHLSLVPKMADTPQQVTDFLNELCQRARPYAEQDWDALKAFARDELGMTDLEPWDVTFASEKLREKRYAFSESEVKLYFQQPKVLEGLFQVVQRLFKVSIKPDQAAVWHPDVQFYRVEDASGQLRAQFYLDLYARPGKRGGAWMDDARSRSVSPEGGVTTPVAYLVCNFMPPTGDQPSLLTHDDVITLFHEFGHGLHHMLTKVDVSGVSGIHGVEWDAVELPSQFMENFCWEWPVLQSMTQHLHSGEPLPRVLYEKMVAAKNFQSGMVTLRQGVFALTDMQLHAGFDPDGPVTALALANAVNDRIHVIPQAPLSRWINTFSHIFAGGYAAGYYSYKWAEVLSADAYAAFEESASETEGTLVSPAGKRFLEEILEVGGSRPALESFIAFRGREPEIEALLRHSGMTETAAA
ncbi:MAG: M3 family metallopeptidase [Pigmentiphaga sp.]